MWSRKRTARALQTVFRFGTPYRRFLILGAAATLVVVALRLVLPWILRGFVEVAFPASDPNAPSEVSFLPNVANPVLWLVGIYLAVAFLTGLAEMLQRVNIKRLAVHSIHDLRGAAVRGASRQLSKRQKGSGDLIARIIGDSARIKAGLSGILVQTFQNGMIFVGVCAVLFFVSWKLATLFLVGGCVAIAVGLWMAARVASTSRKARRKEGKLAAWIQESLDHGGSTEGFDDADDLNESSGRNDVKTTRLIAKSTLCAHVILATAIGVALWVGLAEVRAGTLAPGGFFIFVAYAIIVHRRTVNMGRQAARSGKVLACANRVALLLDDSEGPATSRESVGEQLASGSVRVIERELRLEGVKLFAGRDEQRRTRLKSTNLRISAGQKILVLGDAQSGKSSLLQVLGGAVRPDKGAIFWDDEDVTTASFEIESSVEMLPQEPVFPSGEVWEVLGRDSPEITPAQKKVLRRLAVWDFIRAFPQRLSQKVSSQRLSREESRALCLGGIALSEGRSVWLLDTPLSGGDKDELRGRLRRLLSASAERTVLIAMRQPITSRGFDRVLFLEEGRIFFDGTRQQWKEWKARRQERVPKPASSDETSLISNEETR